MEVSGSNASATLALICGRNLVASSPVLQMTTTNRVAALQNLQIRGVGPC